MTSKPSVEKSKKTARGGRFLGQRAFCGSALTGAAALMAWGGSETVKKATLLKDGTNTLAVEMHQDSPGSSDMSFDLDMRLKPHGLRSAKFSA